MIRQQALADRDAVNREAPLPARGGARSRLARLVPTAVWVLGAVDVISAVTPPERYRLRYLVDVVPLGVVHTATAATTALGLLLVMLARGLRRGKRRAWIAVVGLVAVSVALHLVKGLDVEESLASLALLAALVLTRQHFRAEGDPRSRWRALVVGVELLVVDLTLGAAVVGFASDRVVTGDRGLGPTLLTVLRGLVGISGPLDLNRHRGDAISDILVSLGTMTGLVVGYLLLRAPSQVQPLDGRDEACLRTLLTRHGAEDSLGYFALRHDKSIVFSTSGKAAVAFRVVGGCVLASGDPIGDPEAWPGAIAAWRALAARHGWVPAVVGCSESGAEAWARCADFDALEIGDEAVVRVAQHTLDGRAMRGVRQAVARASRAGYVVRVRRLHEVAPDELVDLRNAAGAWRGVATERGFSMALGRVGEPGDEQCVVATAELDGRLVALLHFVPWGADGLSLDLMRRDAACENGINELLIHRVLEVAPGLGVARVSLNFAVFRAALDRGQRIGAGPVLRLWTSTLLLASRWFQIESLHRFNAKFRPEWEPRFICYPQARDLGRIAVAYLRAEAFLAPPLWWRATRSATR